MTERVYFIGISYLLHDFDVRQIQIFIVWVYFKQPISNLYNRTAN